MFFLIFFWFFIFFRENVHMNMNDSHEKKQLLLADIIAGLISFECAKQIAKTKSHNLIIGPNPLALFCLFYLGYRLYTAITGETP